MDWPRAGERCSDGAGAECSLGERCDEASGVCVCPEGGPCQPPKAASWADLDAVWTVLHAWGIIGLSAVGALLGNAGQHVWGRWWSELYRSKAAHQSSC